jgi:DMSO/TMAO reductase YedYZ molybdopterin-dependent catalytic subunit
MVCATPLTRATAYNRAMPGPFLPQPNTQEKRPVLSRRAFLSLMAAALAACGRIRPPGPTPRPTATRAPRPTLAPAPQVTANRTIPVADLYVKSYDNVATVLAKETWQLQIGGQVAKPLTLKWNDLQSLPQVEMQHTLECIGNPVGGRLLGNLSWKGVRLRDVLALAQPGTTSDHLLMSSADEYYTSAPLELALDESAMIAFEVNGEPLPQPHGFPARILLPAVYGQKQPKWITSIQIVTGYKQGLWEKQGWSDTAVVHVNSRIEYPPENAFLRAGDPLPISGVAFANSSGVARVEVSVDNGEHWADAEILPGDTPQIWTAWQYVWKAPAPGQALIKARATSGAGQVQVDHGGVMTEVFPDGSSSIQSISVTIG